MAENEEFDYADAEKKITAIINWAGHEKPDFDDEFVLDMQEKLDKYGKLFPGQIKAINNIVDRFEIDVDQYSDV
jgi:hypothetical protein